MKMQKTKIHAESESGSPARITKYRLLKSRQRVGRNMFFWSEPTAECIGMRAGKNDTVVSIAWREG